MTIQELFELCIIPLSTVITTCIVLYIRAKGKQLAAQTDNEVAAKYLNLLNNTIADCVLATNQTYVNSLKQQGTFNATAQKVAFNATKEAVLNILSRDAKNYLSLAIGDLDKYVNNCIEAEVIKNK